MTNSTQSENLTIMPPWCSARSGNNRKFSTALYTADPLIGCHWTVTTGTIPWMSVGGQGSGNCKRPDSRNSVRAGEKKVWKSCPTLIVPGEKKVRKYFLTYYE